MHAHNRLCQVAEDHRCCEGHPALHCRGDLAGEGPQRAVWGGADWLFELQGDETGGGQKQGVLEDHPFGSFCPK